MKRLLALTVAVLAVLLLVQQLDVAPPVDASDRAPTERGQEAAAPEGALLPVEARGRSAARSSSMEEPPQDDPASAAEAAVPAARARGLDALLVRALDPRGRPLAGAQVEVVFEGRFRNTRSSKDGTARFEPEGDATFANALVHARHEKLGLASDELHVEDPAPTEPVDLVLLPGAHVDVLVVESDGGAVVPGCTVWADPVVEDSSLPLFGETDETGRARLGPLGPGRVHWRVSPTGAEHQVHGALEITGRGPHELVVRLDEGGKPLAVEGRFVDTRGQPFDGWTIRTVAGYPSLMVGPDLANLVPVHTDGHGRFRYHRAPCDELLVVTNLGGTGHVYAPERVTVPFGTRGLEFRLSRSFEERELTLECVDSVTRRPIESSQVQFYRRDPWLEREATYGATKREGTRLRMTVLAIPGLRYVATSSGYVQAHGTLDELLRSGGRIELTKGQRVEVTVIDADTEAPIEGAAFTLGGEDQVATTDRNGEAVLTGTAFDGRLEVAAQGYRSRRWYASWPGKLIPLTRLD